MQRWIKIIHRSRTETRSTCTISPLTPRIKKQPSCHYRYKITTSRLQPIQCDDRVVFMEKTVSKKVGYLCFVIVDTRELYLEYFEVGKSFRGRGYGKEMYEWMEACAQTMGVERIFLTPYNSAIGFWRKLGFGYQYRDTFEMTKTLR